jgi:hypothetical protein
VSELRSSPRPRLSRTIASTLQGAADRTVAMATKDSSGSDRVGTVTDDRIRPEGAFAAAGIRQSVSTVWTLAAVAASGIVPGAKRSSPASDARPPRRRTRARPSAATSPPRSPGACSGRWSSCAAPAHTRPRLPRRAAPRVRAATPGAARRTARRPRPSLTSGRAERARCRSRPAPARPAAAAAGSPQGSLAPVHARPTVAAASRLPPA